MLTKYHPLSIVVTLCSTMLLCQSCTPVFEKSVTIHFQDKPYTLHFCSLAVHGSHGSVVHLADVLERLEAGEQVDLSVRVGGRAPLHTATQHCADQAHFEVLLRYLLQQGAAVNQLTSPSCEVTPLCIVCVNHGGFYLPVEERIRVLALLFSYGAKMDMGPRANTRKKLDRDIPWIVLCKKYMPKKEVPYSERSLSERYSELYGITHKEEQAAKQEYWTRISHILLADQPHNPLDPGFVDYVEKAGVKAGLVEELRRRQ